MMLKLLLPMICVVPARGMVFSVIPGGDAIKNVVTPFLNSFNTTDAAGNPTYTANIVRVIDPILAMDFNQDDVVSSPDDYRYFQNPARNYYDSGYVDNNRIPPPRYAANDIFIPRDYPSSDYFYQPHDRLPEDETSPWDRIYRPRPQLSYPPFHHGEYLKDSPQVSTTNDEKALNYGPINFDWAPRPKIPIPTTNINYGIVEPNYGNYPIYSFDNQNPVQNFNHQTNPSFNTIDQPASFPPKKLPVSPFPARNSGAIVSPFPAKNAPYQLFRPSDLFKPYTEERIKYLKNLVDPPQPAPSNAVSESDFNSDGVRIQWPRDPKDPQTSYAVLKPVNMPEASEKTDTASTQQIPDDMNKAKALIMIPLSYRPLYPNEPASKFLDTPKEFKYIPSHEAKALSQNEDEASDLPLEQKGSNIFGSKATFYQPLKAGSFNYDEPIRKPMSASNVFNFSPLQQIQKLRANDAMKPFLAQPQGSEEKFDDVRPIVMLSPDEPFLKALASSNSFDRSPLQPVKSDEENSKKSDEISSQSDDQKSDTATPVVMLSPDGSLLQKLASSNQFNFIPLKQIEKSEPNGSNEDKSGTSSNNQRSQQPFDSPPFQQAVKSSQNDWQYLHSPLTQQNRQKSAGAKPIVMVLQGVQPQNFKGLDSKTPFPSTYFNVNPLSEPQKLGLNNFWGDSTLTRRTSRNSNNEAPMVMLNPDESILNALASSNYFNFLNSRQAADPGLNDGRQFISPSVQQKGREPQQNARLWASLQSPNNQFFSLNQQNIQDSQQNVRPMPSLQSRNPNDQFLSLNQRNLPHERQNVRSWPILQYPNQNEQILFPLSLQNIQATQQNARSWPNLQSQIPNEQFFPLNQRNLHAAQQNARSWPSLESPILNEQFPTLNQQWIQGKPQNARSWQKMQTENPNNQFVPLNQQWNVLQNAWPWSNSQFQNASKQFVPFPLHQQWSRNMPQNARSWPNSQSQNPSDQMLSSNIFNFYPAQDPQVSGFDEYMDSRSPLMQQSGRNSDAGKPGPAEDSAFTKGTYRDWLNKLIAKQIAEWDGKRKFGTPLTQSISQKPESPELGIQSPNSRSQNPDGQNLDGTVSANQFNFFPPQESMQSALNDLWSLDSSLTQRSSQNSDGARPMVMPTPINRAADAVKPAEPFLKSLVSPNYYPHSLQQPINLDRNYQDKAEFTSNLQKSDRAIPVVIVPPSSLLRDSNEPLMKALTPSEYTPLSSQQAGKQFQDPVYRHNFPLTGQTSQNVDKLKPILMLVPNSHPEDSLKPPFKALPSSDYIPHPLQQGRLLGQNFEDGRNSPLIDQSRQNVENSKPVVMLVPNSSPVDSRDSFMKAFTPQKYFHPASEQGRLLGHDYEGNQDSPVIDQSRQNIDDAKPIVMMAPSSNPDSYEPLLKAILSSKYSQEPRALNQNHLDSHDLPFKDQSTHDIVKASPILMSSPNTYVVDPDSHLKTIAAPNFFQKLGSDPETADFSQNYDLESDKPKPILVVPVPALSPDDPILNTITSTKNYNLLPIQLPESFLNNLISSGLFSMLFNDLPGGGGSTDVSRAASPDFVTSPHRRPSYTLLSPVRHRVQLYDPTLRGYHGGINPFAHHHTGYGYRRTRF